MSAPERIWFRDCEYVRADTAEAAIDLWRQIAQAGEAQRAETVKQGSVHEHAVRKDAPKT